jgi:phage tail-like protein
MYKLLVVSGVALILLVGLGQSPSNKRSYVAGRFALSLDGSEELDLLRSADGGAAAGQVVEEVQPDGVVRKHLGGVKYEDITLTLGMSMTKAMYDWINASMTNKQVRKNGAIIAADYDYTERSRLEFKNALITEVGFPALDASSKEPSYMEVKFQPESTARVAGSGRKIDPKVQKKWLPANFRLSIEGLEEPTRRVNKVESFSIKMKAVAGGRPELEMGDLSFTCPEAFAKPLYDWHEDFVIKGNNGQDKELGGSIDYLGTDLREVLFTVKFQNLGIFKVSPEKAEAGSENLRRVKAEMYCETMELSPGSPPAQ